MIDLSTENDAASGADENKRAQQPGPNDPFFDPPPEDHVPAAKTSVWKSQEGVTIMIAGVFLPACLMAVSSVVCAERIVRVIFKHPVETLVEIALLLLIPIANYLAWSALCRKDSRHPVVLGLVNGLATMTAMVAAIVAASSTFFGYPPAFLFLTVIAGASCATSCYLTIKMRESAMTQLSRNRKLLYTISGCALSVLALAACEAKGTAVRFGEYLALSSSARDHKAGLTWLHNLDCEQDLRMQCADDRAAGIPGLYFRIDPAKERELYFTVIGKPYGNSLTDSVYAMSDEYLSRHIVGSKVDGLSLVRSAITGTISPQSLSSTMDWTFVFKNATFNDQEARAEIAVPPDAVVSGLTLWIQGESKAANFGATDHVQSSAQWVQVTKNDPALVTDVGRGRVLLKCASIPGQGELKARITFTSKMHPDTLSDASIALPKFIDTNFSLEGSHALRFHSPTAMFMNTKMRNVDAADGSKLLEGNLNDNQLRGSALVVHAARQNNNDSIAVEDKLSPTGGFIIEKLQKVTAVPPDHLVVVIDNSKSMKDKKNFEKIRKALSSMPKNLKASLMMASNTEEPELLPLEEGLKKMEKSPFEGGQNNLESVIKASEIAGETKQGAVLWIHGPQPNFNGEIYIMAPYIAKPRFFELALDEGFTDTNEFFRNHREIGPFAPVMHNTDDIEQDLHNFISKWAPGNVEYGITLERSAKDPGLTKVSGRASEELTKLCSREECNELLRKGQTTEASELASACHIVTPVSAAVVIGAAPSLVGATSGAQTQLVEGGNAPTLAGATNGTIGPQGGDATVITGINTAGTVRVNNLANLEAMLNIMANLAEILGIGAGLYYFARAFMLMASTGNKKQEGAMHSFALGVSMAVLGCMTPGMINWLVSSARDANLFS